MPPLRTLSFIILAFFVGEKHLAAAVCALDQAPTVIMSNEVEHHQYWIIEDDPIFWSDTLPDDEVLWDFRDWVESKIFPDPFQLLKRQRDIYEDYGYDTGGFDDVIDGEVGHISDINCLEALLFSEHASLWDFAEKPTEFAAYIMKRDNEIHITFSSHNMSFIPSSDFIMRIITENIDDDWVLTTHLHNHPFMFDNPSGDIAGTTMPSGTVSGGDVATYLKFKREYDLQTAWITNGFSTIRLDETHFEKMSE